MLLPAPHAQISTLIDKSEVLLPRVKIFSTLAIRIVHLFDKRQFDTYRDPRGWRGTNDDVFDFKAQQFSSIQCDFDSIWYGSI